MEIRPELVLFLVSVQVFRLVTSATPLKCMTEYERYTSECWSTTVHTSRLYRWNCENSQLTACIENFKSSDPDCTTDQHAMRKQEFLKAADVVNNWICSKLIKDFLFDCRDPQAIGRSSGIAFQEQFKPFSTCIIEHLKLELNMRHMIGNFPDNCQKDPFRDMAHTVLQVTACRESPEESWSDYANLTDSQFSACSGVYDTAPKACDPLVQLGKVCENSTWMECLQNEYKKSDSCPLRGLAQWKNQSLEQMKIKRNIICEQDFSEDLKTSLKTVKCKSQLQKSLMEGATTTTNSACRSTRKLIDDSKEQMCPPMANLLQRFTDRVCLLAETNQSLGTHHLISWTLIHFLGALAFTMLFGLF